MNNLIDCDTITALLIDEATRKHPDWELQNKPYNLLREKAKMLDNISDLFDTESIGLYINEDTLEVSYIVKCVSLQWVCDDNFFSVIKDALRTRYYNEDDCIVVEIVFDGIWRNDNE